MNALAVASSAAVLDFAPDDLAFRNSFEPSHEWAPDADLLALMSDSSNSETAPFEGNIMPESGAEVTDVNTSPLVAVGSTKGGEAGEVVGNAGNVINSEIPPLTTPDVDARPRPAPAPEAPVSPSPAVPPVGLPSGYATGPRPSTSSEIDQAYSRKFELMDEILRKEKSVLGLVEAVAELESQVKGERKEMKTQVNELIGLRVKLKDLEDEIDELIVANRARNQNAETSPLVDAGIQAAQAVTDATKALAAAAPTFAAAVSSVASAAPVRTRTVIDPDPAITTDLWVLKSKDWAGGVTNAQVEKLNEQDVRTIANLEEYMRSGMLVPKRVKGLGQAAVDKITDALMAWRAKHRVPEPREVPIEVDSERDELEFALSTVRAPERTQEHVDAAAIAVAGTAEPAAPQPPATPSLVEQERAASEASTAPVTVADDVTEPQTSDPESEFRAAYTAGCEAAVADKPVSDNPHEKGTQMWLAWDGGWQDTNAA